MILIMYEIVSPHVAKMKLMNTETSSDLCIQSDLFMCSLDEHVSFSH